MLSLVLALGSLVAPSDPEEIVGGTPTEPGEFDSVVAVYTPGYICSGTMIAPGLVLTAAHCLDGFPVGAISVAAGSQVSRAQAITAIAAGVHPQYCRTCEPSDDDIFDLGYVRIPEGALALDELATPIVDQDDWDEAIRRGAEVTIVGYGEDDAGVTGIKRKVVTWITDQTATGLEFRAGGDFRDSCRGDSGGPAFVRTDDGRWLQAGVVSRGAEACGSGGVYATAYSALEWLQRETGTPLCGADCDSCECLDITPAPSPESCACSTRRENRMPWLLFVVFLVRRRM